MIRFVVFARNIAACSAVVLLVTRPVSLTGQSTTEASRAPRVELHEAPVVQLSGKVDSNSPATWDLVRGRETLFVMTSYNGRPSTAEGPDLRELGKPTPIVLEPWPGGGVWMEAIVADASGTWYGYYHNEIGAHDECGSDQKVIPRIGAARSEDRGRTWQSLGIILEAPPRSYECDTPNKYFVGGVGDFSVQLDHESQNLYFFYSTYLRNERLQGVAVARLTWADRDSPSGRMMMWRDRTWIPATHLGPLDETTRWLYPPAFPIFPAADSWHDEDNKVDAFWGPSVHWNTHLEQYVMLVSRARDDWFTPEGVYVSFAPDLDNPRNWSTPVGILAGGKWYPQVMGADEDEGTDKVAGEWARFFMAGTSEYIAHFIK
jgi:hypothetical protein